MSLCPTCFLVQLSTVSAFARKKLANCCWWRVLDRRIDGWRIDLEKIIFETVFCMGSVDCWFFFFLIFFCLCRLCARAVLSHWIVFNRARRRFLAVGIKRPIGLHRPVCIQSPATRQFLLAAIVGRTFCRTIIHNPHLPQALHRHHSVRFERRSSLRSIFAAETEILLCPSHQEHLCYLKLMVILYCLEHRCLLPTDDSPTLFQRLLVDWAAVEIFPLFFSVLFCRWRLALA